METSRRWAVYDHDIVCFHFDDMHFISRNVNAQTIQFIQMPAYPAFFCCCCWNKLSCLAYCRIVRTDELWGGVICWWAVRCVCARFASSLTILWIMLRRHGHNIIMATRNLINWVAHRPHDCAPSSLSRLINNHIIINWSGGAQRHTQNITRMRSDERLVMWRLR